MSILTFQINRFVYDVSEKISSVNAIKDGFIRMQLSQNLRAQGYDGASNMLGKKSGVAQPKVLATHCHGHSLNIDIKYTMTNSNFVNDLIGCGLFIMINIRTSINIVLK